MSRGSNEEADALHKLITKRLIERLSDPECSPADIDKAIKFLKDNGITDFEGTLEERDGILGGLSKFRPQLPDLDDDETFAL